MKIGLRSGLALLLSVPLGAADLVEITPVHDRMVLLHFDDGYVDYHEAGEPAHADQVVAEPLAVASLSASAFTISSGGDANYLAGRNPTEFGRKSKGTEFAVSNEHWVGGYGFQPTSPPTAREHWVYLELPAPMVAGQTYEIGWDASALNTTVASATLTMDAGAVRSEAIHVNQIGYDPVAPLKYGYVYHWAGDLGAPRRRRGLHRPSGLSRGGRCSGIRPE